MFFMISGNSMDALTTDKWNWRNAANVIDEAKSTSSGVDGSAC